MPSRSLLSTGDAARQLAVQPSRVRALLAAGELTGFKLGERWVVEADSVRRRQAGGAVAGRLLEPANAWALLALASGDDAPELTADARWRLRRLLDREGLEGLAPRLRRRARRSRYQAHPGVLAELAHLPELVATGISAADVHGLDLVAGGEIDAYVSSEALATVIDSYALEPVRIGGNASLRVVPGEPWPFAEDQTTAPVAAVALDLSEEPESRSARVGHEALVVLSRQRRWAASEGPTRRRRRA